MKKISINYSITDDKIKVESSSTIFINTIRRKTIDVRKLDNDIKVLRKICKEQKIIFSQKNGLYKFFKEHKNDYLEEMKEVNELFNSLVKGWQEKVKKGIYTGYSSDEDLDKLPKIKNKIDQFFYGGTTISQINSLNTNVKHIYENLERKDITLEKVIL